MKHTLAPTALALTSLAAGLALLAPEAARAAAPTAYTIQPIVKLGDKVADVTIRKGGDFEIGALNDQGQIAFVTENGGTGGGEMLLQYADGQFTPIAVNGRDAPGGKWATGSGIYFPASMNQRGDIAFATTATIGGMTGLGMFRWDYPSQRVILVAFPGMPAVNGLTFVNGNSGGGYINSGDEVVFSANVKNAAGQTRSGVFLLGQDGQLQAVALPDQVLPDGAKVQDAQATGMTDAGVIGFETETPGAQTGNGFYVWEKGTITPIAVVGMPIPGLGKVAQLFYFYINNKDDSALVVMRLNSTSAPWGFYRWANGQMTQLFTQGKALPGGGQLGHFSTPFGFNDAGQFAFPNTLPDGSTAVYLLDPDGTLSLILKSGTITDLGTITQILTTGSSPPLMGIGLNGKGQVVLPVRIDGGPATLVLLTPTGL